MRRAFGPASSSFWAGFGHRRYGHSRMGTFRRACAKPTPVEVFSRARPCSESGFTLIEVLVAMLILLVGVLGVVTLVDGANAVTSKTKAREGGTAIARSVIEVSRSIRYRDLNVASLEAALASRPGLADAKPSTPGYQIQQRGIYYTMTLTVCSLDDDKDDLGARPTGVTFCSDSLGPPVTPRDRNPDDYKRVRVHLDWSTRATAHSVTQTSSIINPVGGLGPSVTGLTMTSPASSSTDEVRIESSSASPINSANFLATTSGFAADLQWSINGDSQGKASGGPTNWTFTWSFTKSGSDPDNIVYYDCKYFIQADAFDAEGRAGSPRVLTVILNRREPVPVANVTAGRNGSGDRVDVRWTPNPECDVIGYRVFRSTASGALGTQVSCPDANAPSNTVTTRQWCVDETAPATGPLYYSVVGVDTLANGSLRQGTPSAQVTVPASGGNNLPTAPANISLCTGGQPGCNKSDGNPAPSGQIVVTWDPSTDSDGTVSFYRIYRDGTAYTNRWDDFFPGSTGGSLAWLEYAPGTGSHTYRVSAVDNLYGESGLSDPVSSP
jgi:prepilin-type N-terminal cleavage/methylation domain-containing protein